MPSDDAPALAEQLERPCEHVRSSLSVCVPCLAAALAAAREAGAQAAAYEGGLKEGARILQEVADRCAGFDWNPSDGNDSADPAEHLVANINALLERLDTDREAGRQQGLKALKAAVALIREWHGFGMGASEAEAWALYQGSPEMKPILAALAEGEHN